jgi:SAM-dependent methyltransferase
MNNAARTLVVFGVIGPAAVPLVTLLCAPESGSVEMRLSLLLCLTAVGLVGLVAARLLRAAEPWLAEEGRLQGRFLDSLGERWLSTAVFGAAALSLLLELAIIRWQATVFEFFALYKNFGLLACFAGLGFGYALAGRAAIPLFATLPLLAWQFGFLIALRRGLSASDIGILRRVPFQEQLNMGVTITGVLESAAVYFFLAVTFVLTALALVPVGQLCGRLMERRGDLRGYGLNLLGSVAGVAAIFALSAFWTPPPVWYGLAFLILLLLLAPHPRTLRTGIAWALLGLVILSWNFRSDYYQRIYSPYQLLEIGHGKQGLPVVLAAGHYYQRILDLSDDATSGARRSPELVVARNYYSLPYRFNAPGARVAIVGAGTGNDAAAALRAGASRVDAIEIDPAIMALGRAHHVERPYSDPRVRVVLDDARAFLREGRARYDVIVYGLLDSHTLLSHVSSVRLDTFVYTVEALREARARLNPEGVLSLSFSIIDPLLATKLYRMMGEAFDGRPPLVILSGYDGSMVFLQGGSRTLSLTAAVAEATGFRDVTANLAASSAHTDNSTDDWPFLYMPARIYPLSYLVMVGVVVLLSAWMGAAFSARRPMASDLPFFFLGAGFMLLETKAITELGLTFGSTWQVTAVVIVSFLLMAFLGNALVRRWRIRAPAVPFALLMLTLGLGWVVSRGGGLAPTALGRLGTVVLLASPLLFSGVSFSTLLARRGLAADAMAFNVIGAMVGGLVEYNSMYFGFRSLYLVAGVFYAFAFASALAVFKEVPVAASAPGPA